ncbi:MAG: hypothetical protein E7177_07925 [Erysipelotrichaceae bacterium]|nr:hypothetical protein [Erysipelotrichaceae bacterium]
MKNKISILILSLFLAVGCGNNSSENLYKNVPAKINANGVGIEDSSINTRNIDNYLFRDDVVYVDLRSYAEIATEGHIAGFSFYPFYDFIATKENAEDYEGNPINDRLFRMKAEYGQTGLVGNFEPNYEESVMVLNDLFPKDKYIFAITISCNEVTYFFNLLIQYGYNPAYLYNIGGFSIGTGFYNIAYVNIENPKYLVKGNSYLYPIGQFETFDFMKDLTPITKV